MSQSFFESPILNSPYQVPGQHWELDRSGQPTNQIIAKRRAADFITPIPKPRKQRANQIELEFAQANISTDSQQYDSSLFINSIREKIAEWRRKPNPHDWKVTPETAKLLQHWRHHNFAGVRPFFCQIEAVETAIWLAEVAPNIGKQGDNFLEKITDANLEANPEIFRIAFKLATGAGKTTVMAMLIAWHTINAVRHPQSKKFTRGFLIITPGITIRDRLQILQPNHPENYYKNRELVPHDLLAEMARAKIVITNYHAFKLREKIEISAGNRRLLQGRGKPLNTLETEGQMIQRVMPELMGMKSILVLNDEAHHCYREKPNTDELDDLKGDDKEEAKKNNEAARLWISGIEMVKRKLGVNQTYDLSATPFFLRGSGYAEGTLFPWTVSDFSLMDAIESGIVKLPRVPVSDNVPGEDMPKYRNLWEHIKTKMPKKGRSAASGLDPLSLPLELQTALDALYGHYEKTDTEWQKSELKVPPVFIIVCNNTSTSKLVYDYISGFERKDPDGNTIYNTGRLELFRNYDDNGNRLSKPKTLLIDSEQLESGEGLEPSFREIAADEIDKFRRELVDRKGMATSDITDQDLLREVMNTVGKIGKLGESIRCVVSVSMLTEGWDCSSVTHILGIRAFGTQLLCEQVIGRALRRYSYDLNENQLFDVEYADIFGIPFDFTAKPVIAQPKPPKKTIYVCAVNPDRDYLEITFPRVEGYRAELPQESLKANFTEDSVLELNPDLVGPTKTRNQGIIGEGADFDLEHLEEVRTSTVIYYLTKHLIYHKYRDANEDPRINLFGQLKRIVRQWLDGGYCRSTGGTCIAQLMYRELADMACERIKVAITQAIDQSDRPIKAILDAYNPRGSTVHIGFNTSKQTLWQTAHHKSHINWVVCDSDWEAEFCRVVEGHPRVRSYVKNQGLGLEVPYLSGDTPRKYLPDFIVQIDDGKPDLLNLIVEIKGYRGEDAKEKSLTMQNYWIPGVNHLGKFGRWAFREFTAFFEIESEFYRWIDEIVV